MINNILITSAGRRVSLVKIFQETLKRFNKRGKVFAADMNPFLSSACYIADEFTKVPRVTDENYIPFLLDYCLKKDVSIVVPTIDTELSKLAYAKRNFLKHNILIAISSSGICNTFYLKESTGKFFVENGFNTPKLIENLEKCSYPVFAKLNNSSSSIGAQVVYSPEIAKELCKKGNYIFQEYIEGIEFTVDVFIDSKSNIISIVPRERIEVRAGEVSKGKTVKDKKIMATIKKFCEKLAGAYGCLTIQVFKSRDKVVFIEVNPRFGGGYPLSYFAGANFADYLIRDYLGEELEYNENWKNNTLMLRYDAEVIIDGSSI